MNKWFGSLAIATAFAHVLCMLGLFKCISMYVWVYNGYVGWRNDIYIIILCVMKTISSLLQTVVADGAPFDAHIEPFTQPPGQPISRTY